MLWVWMGVLGGYGLGAVVTARTVFERGRACYLDGSAGGSAGGRSVAEFERRERQHVEAVALFAGVLWVTVVPVLLLRRLVAGPGPGGADPQAVRDRIEELERTLGMGAYENGGPAAGPWPPPSGPGLRRP
ncbi:hypothetical protein ACIQ9P_08485 [Kitasatospora sp. NPDC094019]|uniref:hypothetical protein n=1 Tax=Kitasatospora sp. NPDC094019 TaxID=3364091 RepID=UPI00382514BE